MNSSKTKVPKIVYDWFHYAKDDLTALLVLSEHLASTPNMGRSISFHAQQCVEKSIKGLLTYHKIKFSKIHDIKELSRSLLPLYNDLEQLLLNSDKLTRYAAEYRYPEAIDKPITLDEIKSCIELAKEVFRRTCEKIPFDSSLF